MTKRSSIIIWSIVAGLVVLVAAPVAITLGFSTTSPKSATATKTAIPPASESPTEVGTALTLGFEPESASFVSADTGFVLGIGHCSSGSCVTIARTQDGGITWTSIPAPDVSLTQSGNPKSSTDAVSKIRFLNINVGYVFGPDLYATRDGGTTWRKIILLGIANGYQVTSLETNGNKTYLIASNPNVSPSPNYLFISEATTGIFIKSKSLFSTGTPTQISVNPYGAVLTADNHGAVLTPLSAQIGILYFQATGTANWTRIKAHCLGGLSANPVVALATPVLGSSTPQLILGCGGGAGAGSQEKTVFESADMNTSRATPSRPPLNGILEAVASPDGVTIAVAASSGATFLYVSIDSGATWKTAISNSTLGGAPIHDLGFTTATQGFAVVGHAITGWTRTSTFVMTHDQGISWQEISF